MLVNNNLACILAYCSGCLASGSCTWSSTGCPPTWYSITTSSLGTTDRPPSTYITTTSRSLTKTWHPRRVYPLTYIRPPTSFTSYTTSSLTRSTSHDTRCWSRRTTAHNVTSSRTGKEKRMNITGWPQTLQPYQKTFFHQKPYISSFFIITLQKRFCRISRLKNSRMCHF